MDSIISILPDIMIYLVSGFLFIRIFSFVSTTKRTNDYQHIIVKSVIVGYILKYIGSMIPALTSVYALNILGFLGICCVLAYICARVYTSKWFYSILRLIGIQNTLNDELWVDIEGDKSVWAEIYSHETNEYYFGLVCLSENFKDNPKIVLKRYAIFKDTNDDPIKDYNNDPCKRILIDTSKCDVIKLTYSNENEIVKRELRENGKDYIIHNKEKDETK